MLSRNFYHRIKYQIDKKATNKVLFQFILDRLKHPFQKFQKKRLKKQHQIYLRKKKPLRITFLSMPITGSQ